MNNEPVAWIKQGRLGYPVLEFDKPFRYESYAIQNPLIPLYTHPVKELTIHEDIVYGLAYKYGIEKGDVLDFSIALLKKASER